jgi:hypothetical protein
MQLLTTPVLCRLYGMMEYGTRMVPIFHHSIVPLFQFMPLRLCQMGNHFSSFISAENLTVLSDCDVKTKRSD